MNSIMNLHSTLRHLNSISTIALAALIMTASVANAAITPLDSASFNHKYEGVGLMNDPQPNVGTTFGYKGIGGLAQVSDGDILTLTAFGGYLYTPPAGFWNEVNGPLGTHSFTVEARLQTTGSDSQNGTFGNYAPNTGGDTYVVIGNNRFGKFNGAGGEVDISGGATNSDTFHVFRWAVDAATPGVVNLWRDGISLGTVSNNSGNPGDEFNLGSGSPSSGGINLIDYFRVDTTGAYSPVPIPEPSSCILLLIGGAAMASRWRSTRKVRSAMRTA